MNETIEIRVNGEARRVAAGQTIGRLLEELGIEKRHLAIECNGEFLEDEGWEAREFRAGDTLEIVRFVGGG